MPSADLDVVAGDPDVVAAVARTLSSIADDVARHAATLRSLASSGSSWTGKAAVGARGRSATLPPKLDKVTASYGRAGGALLGYARALADAQQRSRSAVASYSRADDDLRSARLAQAAAAAADSQAAAAAAAAGQPTPAPAAPRYQASIDEAASRLARARAENERAHADRDHSAAVAAAQLKAASHEGIRNQSWWHHVTHAVGHWASTQWRKALAQIAVIAGEISILTCIAGAVLAIGGLFFPPLELAAAAVEEVSIVSGMVSNVSATVVELSDKRTRKAGVISLGFLLMPAAARRVFRRMPPVSNPTVLSVVEQTEPRTIPLGFPSKATYDVFTKDLRDGLEDRYPATVGIMQGSSVTGFSYKTGLPFDEGRLSDYDVALAGPDIFAAARRAGVNLRGAGIRTVPLSRTTTVRLGLRGLQRDLSRQAKRPVHFMIYRSIEEAVSDKPSIRMK